VMDVHSQKQRSYNMSRIRGKNTKPELLLRKGLWQSGLRYRIHVKLPGKPDIVFTRQRLVIFVDGCFWHGCPEHSVKPRTNSEFWNTKLSGNIERDKANDKKLTDLGWTVMRFWEHDVKKDIERVIDNIKFKL